MEKIGYLILGVIITIGGLTELVTLAAVGNIKGAVQQLEQVSTNEKNAIEKMVIAIEEQRKEIALLKNNQAQAAQTIQYLQMQQARQNFSGNTAQQQQARRTESRQEVTIETKKPVISEWKTTYKDGEVCWYRTVGTSLETKCKE